jgi:hypothetical protein
MDVTEVLAWLLGAVAAVVGALTTAVIKLWSQTVDHNKHTAEKLAQCEEDRLKLTKEVGAINRRVTKIENGQ